MTCSSSVTALATIDRIELFRLTLTFFDDASEFSVTSLYVVFISSSKFMLIFLLYNKSSVVAEMGDRLATIDMRRRGGCCAPSGGSWAPSNTMWPGAEINLRIKWHLDPSGHFATIDMGQKVGVLARS